MTELDPKNLLTKKEKAAELGISISTIKRHIKKNKIPFVKIPSSKRMWFYPENVSLNA